ncbi:MAG: T9SS type A sorting domain-containing protein [Bacteroidia bacterium]|nr:T9SS type A sorting domain-containing protein [Bacteroidia bacterium]
MRFAFLLPLLSFITGSSFAQSTCCKYGAMNPLHEKFAESPALQADNLRSDTINILKYSITLDITDFTTDTVRGNCAVRFAPRMNNVNTLSLDLLKLTIDSVRISGNPAPFSYNDTLLIIALPFTHTTTDTSTVSIYYHGKPQQDASGWGGWYNQGNYAYNLGVGFAADPHVFGRIWFPCFDNFVERSKYKMIITTNAGKIAYCNGALTKDTTVSGNRVRTWELNEEIPTYLASVSVAPYTHVNQTFSGINGTVPVMLTAQPADTTNMKNSFINLSGAFGTFENRYGPYRWNRVGFCLVPFNSGAMEHATNISYPLSAANGSTALEYLMAHEFSHHWWGDLVTCRTQGDMWINEGLASYSEAIFMEGIYGYGNYISYIKNNHDFVVHYTHITDGAYRALSGMPHAYTYGDHTYKKGSDVAHTLRGYLGDSLFFAGLQYIQNNFQYTDIDAVDFRDAMSTATGVNMNNFFNDWVLNPGFPHFSVDSAVAVPNGNNFDVTVFLKQKITGAPALFNGVPLKLYFRSAGWSLEMRNVSMSGATANFTFTLPFNPVFTGVNVERLISDAKTTDEKVIKTTGFHFANNAAGRMRVQINNTSITTDSAYLFIEHSYAAPDPHLSWGIPYRLSPGRFWKVSGIFPPGFDATGYITYDGRNTTSGGGGYLDNALLPTNNLEDSVVLLYRPDTRSDWYEYPWYTKNTGVLTDKFGNIVIDSLLPGEYTIGRHDYTLSLPGSTGVSTDLNIYPNPAQDEVYIMCGENNAWDLFVHDLSGREIYRRHQVQGTLALSLFGFEQGIYLITVRGTSGIRRGKLVVQ